MNDLIEGKRFLEGLLSLSKVVDAFREVESIEEGMAKVKAREAEIRMVLVELQGKLETMQADLLTAQTEARALKASALHDARQVAQAEKARIEAAYKDTAEGLEQLKADIQAKSDLRDQINGQIAVARREVAKILGRTN